MANKFKTAVVVSVEGVEDTIRRLAQLDRKAARVALRKGINEITKDVLRDAKALVPRRTGLLRKSLGRLVKTAKDGSSIYGVVKPRKGFKRVVNGKAMDPRNYAHLVEYGRAVVVPKRKKVLADGVPGVSGLPGQGRVFGRRVKAAPPRPFLRPAWEMTRPRAAAIVAKWVGEGLRKFWERTRNRGRKAA